VPTSFQILKKLSKKTDGLPSLKVALLGDTATQLLATAIRGTGAERGYNIDLFEGEYNQIERQILDPSSDYHAFGAKYTVIFQSTHKLLEQYSLGDEAFRSNLAEERIGFVKTICDTVSGPVIYFNYPEINDEIAGSFSNSINSSFIFQLRKLNYELMNLAATEKKLFICDIAGVQSKYGRDYMFDSSVYTSTEMILSIDALPLVSSRTMDIICALEGKIKKCLVLDLDNTLWGGVVGDDGWENIQIGHGLGIGKAFSEFQQWIKKLKDRGIILCVCSKNDEEKAKEPFIKNPEMVLKLEDIAVFVANWDTKADNIKSIREILNIGFDSMVFLDDNPFEREMVRSFLPDVCVPDLPEDPADYLEYLYSLNLFETASVSAADKDRTSQYQSEAKRVQASKSFASEDEYLQSLGMQCTVEGFTGFNTPRVSQLSQRSNQFNLRTIRYTEAEISGISSSHDHKGFAFSLKDKFGDNGLIAVVILKALDKDNLFIDTWFMSCRVLKRGMENFTLNTIMNYANEFGYSNVIGEYIPTSKNGMVADHYQKLGFANTQTENQFIISVKEYQRRKCFIDQI